MDDSNHWEFLQAVIAQPLNMDVRRVYADWLEEQGDPRADFIRVQFELAQLRTRSRESTSAVAALQTREKALLQKHGRYWNGLLHRFLARTPLAHAVGRRQPIRSWRYRRGFVEDLRVTAQAFLDHPEILFSLGPIQCVRLREVSSEAFQSILHSAQFHITPEVHISMPWFREPEMRALVQRYASGHGPKLFLSGMIAYPLPWQSPRRLRENFQTLLRGGLVQLKGFVASR